MEEEPGLDYDYEEERRKEFENAYTLYLEAIESKNIHVVQE